MTFQKASENILFSGDNYARIKRGIDELYQIFSSATGVLAGDLSHEQYIATENGLAVAQGHAAHCLIDLMRTTRFLRGIHKAIKDQLSQQTSIKILYAGCGPYATLLTPLTTQFSSDQVQFTMLDINSQSTEAMQDLYTFMGLEDYLEEVIVVDAVSADFQPAYQFDIIISETMAQALKVECQVPLTRNTVRHLKDTGTFIPQCITVDAYLNSYEEDSHASSNTLLGTVYQLDFRSVPEPGCSCEFNLPEQSFDTVLLYTTIQVYKNQVIGHYQSGLTSPLPVKTFSNGQPKTISFEYTEGHSCDYKIACEY